MVAPIHSVKHYFQRAITNVPAASILNEVVIDSVVASAVSTANEVIEGSLIKAVFVEIWAVGIGAAGTTSGFNISLEKLPAAAVSMTSAQSVNLMVYPNKKNILYTTQGILATVQNGSNTTPLLKQWFAIPKGKQRFGLGDQLMLNFSSLNSDSYQICGLYVFKEYT